MEQFERSCGWHGPRASRVTLVLLVALCAAGPSAAAGAAVLPPRADGQTGPAFGTESGGEPNSLEFLVAEVRRTHPAILAAQHAARAAAARIPQAGAPPDPVLGVGVAQAPLGMDFGAEPMTMVPIRLSQRIPARGTLSLRESMAREAYGAARFEAVEAELDLVKRLKQSYFEAYFVARATAVLERNRALVVDFAEVARGRYAVGRLPQRDVLIAQSEIVRLDEQLSTLRARGAVATADVNAVVGRPTTHPVAPVYPASLMRVALAAPESGWFTAAALDAVIAPGLPALAELQTVALRRRPEYLAHLHRLERARQGVLLADRQRRPDVDVMVEYGARSGHPDLFSGTVSIGLPVFARRKQAPQAAEARHLLAEHEAKHHGLVRDMEAQIAASYAEAVRVREQILLLVEGVVPQSRAVFETASAEYRAGESDFTGLLEAQSALFRNEIELARRLADFGNAMAALERAVGFPLIGEEPT